MKTLLDAIVKYIVLPFATPTTPGSIGRLLLSITFLVALGRFWFFKQDPPTTMMEVLFTLLVYIFGTKIMDWKRGTSSDIPLPTTTQAPVEEAPIAPADPNQEVK
jgi:hypothetical protein